MRRITANVAAFSVIATGACTGPEAGPTPKPTLIPPTEATATDAETFETVQPSELPRLQEGMQLLEALGCEVVEVSEADERLREVRSVAEKISVGDFAEYYNLGTVEPCEVVELYSSLASAEEVAPSTYVAVVENSDLPSEFAPETGGDILNIVSTYQDAEEVWPDLVYSDIWMKSIVGEDYSPEELQRNYPSLSAQFHQFEDNANTLATKDRRIVQHVTIDVARVFTQTQMPSEPAA